MTTARLALDETKRQHVVTMQGLLISLRLAVRLGRLQDARNIARGIGDRILRGPLLPSVAKKLATQLGELFCGVKEILDVTQEILLIEVDEIDKELDQAAEVTA